MKIKPSKSAYWVGMLCTLALLLSSTVPALAAITIAYTSFEEAAFFSGEYTDADTTDHLLVNNVNEPVVAFTPGVGDNELSFSTFFSDVRTGGLSDGDFIGVKTTSSQLTEAYPDGSQGFRFQDPDGTLTVTLGTVSLSGYVDPKVSAAYFLAVEDWESADFARLWVEVDGGTEIDLFNTIGSDIDDLSVEGSWNLVMADLTGYSTAIFRASFSSDAGVEEMWIDNIQFTASSQIPEPSRVVLLTIGMLALIGRRTRH